MFQVFACKTCNPPFTLNVLVGNCMATCTIMFTFKHISVKSKSVFFSLLFTKGSTVETQYTVIEQKKIYSNAYSEQNIHETQEHSVKKKKKNSKKPK